MNPKTVNKIASVIISDALELQSLSIPADEISFVSEAIGTSAVITRSNNSLSSSSHWTQEIGSTTILSEGITFDEGDWYDVSTLTVLPSIKQTIEDSDSILEACVALGVPYERITEGTLTKSSPQYEKLLCDVFEELKNLPINAKRTDSSLFESIRQKEEAESEALGILREFVSQ